MPSYNSIVSLLFLIPVLIVFTKIHLVKLARVILSLINIVCTFGHTLSKGERLLTSVLLGHHAHVHIC